MKLYREADAPLLSESDPPMTNFDFLFMADCQLGAYASFSGMTEADIADFAERNMLVRMTPKVEGFAWDADRLERAIKEANRTKPAFVMIGGDMIDDLSDPAQLQAYRKIIAGLHPDIRLYVAPGNHDVSFDAALPSHDSVMAYRARFGNDHYLLTHGDLSLVVLNTTVLSNPLELPDEAERQLKAVEKNMAKGSRTSGRTIMVGHHPLFLDHPDEEDSYWNMPKAVRLPLIELAHRYGVETMFAGHLHRNNIASDGSLEVVASGAVGYSLGHDPSGLRTVRVTAENLTHSFSPLLGSEGEPLHV